MKKTVPTSANSSRSNRFLWRDFLLLNFANLSVILALYPLYREQWFMLAAGASVVAANAVTLMLQRFRLQLLSAVLSVYGTFFIVAIFVAVPSLYSDFSRLPEQLLNIFIAPIAGWKQILTIDLPLGTYQTTLAPAVFLMLVPLACSLLVAFFSNRGWFFAVPILFVAFMFALALGSSSVSTRVIPGFVQIILACNIFIASLLFIYFRAASLRTNTAKKAVRVTTSRQVLSRALAMAVMLMLALSGGVLIAANVGSAQPRQVLRTAFDPAVTVLTKGSPLTAYRSYFGADLFAQELFSYTPIDFNGRLRLAVMNNYDGVTASVLGEGAPDDTFKRVPALFTSGSPAPESLQISYSAYNDIWVPLAGDVQRISFAGAAREALEDNFFVHNSSGTGVQLSEVLQSSAAQSNETENIEFNQSFEFKQNFAESIKDVSAVPDFVPLNAGPRVSVANSPASLAAWVKQQGFTGDAQGFLLAIENLRERGFLSHGLMANESAQWIESIEGYTFEPSRAGHFTARIENIFSALYEQEDDSVVAVGDDEQFAIAAFLLADHFGFETRVALGFRVGDAATTELNSCAAGVCNGGDLSAWVEIRDSVTGDWAAVDVTPQHANSPETKSSLSSDPKNVTEVTDPEAEVVQRSEASPTAPQNNQSDPQDETVKTSLWQVLRVPTIIALGLLTLLLPVILLALVKVLRLLMRKSSGSTNARAQAAWNEFYDAALDAGANAQGTKTRLEAVRALSLHSPQPEMVGKYFADHDSAVHDSGVHEFAGRSSLEQGLRQLSKIADHAAFAGTRLEDSQAETAWGLALTQRRALRSTLSFRKRIAYVLSLKSFKKSKAADARKYLRFFNGLLIITVPILVASIFFLVIS